MRRDLGVSLALAVGILAVYGQVARHDFLSHDDHAYVYENPQVVPGLTWGGVRWAFTTLHQANWHPLVWLSHMADCQLFGLWAGGHHLTSVLLHGANSILLYVVLKRLTAAPWRSAMVAALFALHPLHVESVAWVAERKDVLSTLFWILTLGAYAWYAVRPGFWRYLSVVVFLALGLMSKPMLVTVPFVLLLLDYWPLGRLRWGENVGRRVLEKAPLLALAAASSGVTLVAQHSWGAMPPTSVVPLDYRFANALLSYVTYIGKMFWPSHLAVHYPYPSVMPTWQQWAGAAILLVAITVVVILAGRRRRYLAFGWFWYLGTLVPVIGLVQVGAQAMADRYTYMPLVGLFIAMVWGAADVAAWASPAVAGRRWGRIGLAALGSAGILGCMAVTWVQVGYWRNRVALFEHALQVTTDNTLAHVILGAALLKDKKVAEAIAHYEKALRIDPRYAAAHSDLAIALKAQGRLDEAVDHGRIAVRLSPWLDKAHFALADVLTRQGRLEEAVAEYRAGLQINPDRGDMHNDLAFVFWEQGRWDDAVAEYREAVRLKPDNRDIRGNLAKALARQGQLQEAVDLLRETLRIRPDDADTYGGLGDMLTQQGRLQDAADAYGYALRLKPDNAEGHNALGAALARLGRRDEAVVEYREALRLRPDLAEAHGNLALALAQEGRLDEAVAEYREALRLKHGGPDVHYNLALALVRRGGPGAIEEAVAHYRCAIALKPDDPMPYGNLAWLRATHPDARFRDGAEAVVLAERACALTGRKNPTMLDTLAAAYAEAGRFPEAEATAQEAAAVAASAGAGDLAPAIAKRLEQYRMRRPCRDVQLSTGAP